MLGGAQKFHGKKEVLRTELERKEFTKNIVEKCIIMDLQHYIAKYNGSANIPSNVFVTRQKYNTKDESVLPPLYTLCHCKEILNPDDEVLICEYCQKLNHLNCVKNDLRKSCYFCKKIIFHPPLSLNIKRNSSTVDMNPVSVSSFGMKNECMYFSIKNSRKMRVCLEYQL
jgi:hypothetical protein